jgi:molybdenum cofactor cytidylyltransferase
MGPPTLFPAAFFADLLALDGDHGARALLERDPARVARLPAPEAFLDLDTPADYERLLAGPAADTP